MNELMERMQDLLDEARKQGIAEALQRVRDTRDAVVGDPELADYLEGLQDAINIIEQI